MDVGWSICLCVGLCGFVLVFAIPGSNSKTHVHDWQTWYLFPQTTYQLTSGTKALMLPGIWKGYHQVN